jgi:hypothetical protein
LEGTYARRHLHQRRGATRSVNAPQLVALVRAGAKFDKGVIIERANTQDQEAAA